MQELAEGFRVHAQTVEDRARKEMVEQEMIKADLEVMCGSERPTVHERRAPGLPAVVRRRSKDSGAPCCHTTQPAVAVWAMGAHAGIDGGCSGANGGGE